MSQIAFTPDERIERLRRFGYTDREAAFLGLAGLHSGYFLRRHYVRFLGTTVGGTAAALIEKALARGHLKSCTYVANTHIYHLGARSFYAALGQEDNRNRRDRQPLTVKSKLMCLDYVLDHPAHAYLSTEQEKVAYFTGARKVQAEALPAKHYHASVGDHPTTRYFVEKYPIYTTSSLHRDDSEVTFCYVDAGATTVSGFETYLDHYTPLFGLIPRFHVLYVASRPLMFDAAARSFARFVLRTEDEHVSSVSLSAALRDYFDARFRYEQSDLASFDRAALIRLRDQRREFSGADTESCYQRWRACRERNASSHMEETGAAPPLVNATFSTCLLEHNYDVFGTLTAF